MKTEIKTKKPKLQTLTGDLPFFAGFYETIYLYESDQERDVQNYESTELIENYEKEYSDYIKLNHVEKYTFTEYLNTWVDQTFNGYTYSEATQKISGEVLDLFFTSVLEKSDRELLGIENYTLNFVDSPQYYNYETDKIIFNVSLDIAKFKKTIKKLAAGQYKELFETVIHKNHSSRDGFSSFFSDDPKEWLLFDSKTLSPNQASKSDTKIDNIMLETYLEFYALTLMSEDDIREILYKANIYDL